MVEITIVAVGIIRYKEKRKSSTCHSLDLLSHHLRLLLGQRVWQFYWHIFVSEMCHRDDVLYRRKESKYRQNWQCMFVWQTNKYPNRIHCFFTLNSHICRLSNADWRTSLLNYKIVTCLGSVFYFSSFLSYSITWRHPTSQWNWSVCEKFGRFRRNDYICNYHEFSSNWDKREESHEFQSKLGQCRLISTEQCPRC